MSSFSRTSRASRRRRTLRLAADTAVVVNGTVLGKPLQDDEVRRMLQLLSGREHRVLTGISLRRGLSEFGGVESTVVWFDPLSRAEIDWYVASGEGRDKAGGYAIQGLASRFIPRIDGSYSNVVGLPVHRVGQLIAEMGYAQVDPEPRSGRLSDCSYPSTIRQLARYYSRKGRVGIVRC